ncbi:hypothetical protein AB0F77_41745 [Streptomyces sp. NPDC026672]|uniref:hypothetical protein n=1 Tax=unclassified Streptomyces TaxID=2593676 RepID=UPI0033DF73ED
MLRIVDDRTGEPVHAAPARRGLTRVEAHAPDLTPTALRVLLTADLLVRALELGGTPVWSLLSAGDHRPGLRAAAATLGVRPFEDAHDPATALGESQIVHVAGADAAPPERGLLVRVARVEDTAGVLREGGVRAVVDPGALRLALLAAGRDSPVRLDPSTLDDAARTLARWRGAVAAWARQPSRAVPEEVRGRLRAAWEDDLDVPGVLRVLASVETDDALPDGARFETYAYADRLLALDLTRDLGNPT